jgi:hypothetical protein
VDPPVAHIVLGETHVETVRYGLAVTIVSYQLRLWRSTGELPAQRGRHPRGVQVILQGGRLASWYRIADYRYTQISRTLPGQHRYINTLEPMKPLRTGGCTPAIMLWRPLATQQRS